MGTMTKEAILNRSLLLDIETTRSGRIRQVGAVLNTVVFERKTQAHSRGTLESLDALADNADFVLGHNLLGHDFPILKASLPHLRLLKKPVIDTLYLSPLAFPQNPYHKLVKDYKLVRASINDPVSDARLAAAVFMDQLDSFAAIQGKNPQQLDFFKFCFEKSNFNGFSGEGFAAVFNSFYAPGFEKAESAMACFLENTGGLVCSRAVVDTISAFLEDAARRPALAYCLAWLQVSGSNSVLPPWVRQRFPEISFILKKLRDESCGRSECGYCAENHNPDEQLKRFFGFPCFREKPADADGKSLQRAIVAEAMKDLPLIAILPTGGGKSLCYQLPALVRHRRRGLLTVVISPLQALMKDQVDNLAKNTGTPFAEAIYGLLTPPERGAVLERVRLGDVAVLYIAPEQLRSRSIRNVLRHREIGCWVFDEAHCLSKWGHDFRPDYLYAARFIRDFCKEDNQTPPPICGYTATAKLDVIDELTTHFRDVLHQDLKLFAGNVERDNLTFEILPVTEAQKYEKAAEIIKDLLERNAAAGAVIYCATRQRTEEVKDFLSHAGISIEAFHGGMEAKTKREVIDAFVAGEIPVISATNAFGMGVDKPNIRLVLHFDMPGSLENYIQEAGRAGRDNAPAHCVLFYEPEDANRQFHMGAMSEIKRIEIERILKALRRVKQNAAGEIVITSDELLRDEELTYLDDKKKEIRDTKVKTAISWLERSGFLKRNENLTDVFQGKPVVKNLDEAQEIIQRLNLAPTAKNLWLNILRLIFNSPTDRGLSADGIAEGLFPDREQLKQMETQSGLRAAQIVINALHDMAEAGLLDRGIMLSAILRPKGKNNAMKVLQSVIAVEQRLLAIMQTEDPEADDGSWVELNVRGLCQKLKNESLETSPHVIQGLIKGLSYDGKGLSASIGSFELQHVGRDHYRVRLQRSWDAIKKTMSLRHDVAHAVLETLIQSAEKQMKASELGDGEVNIAFSSTDLTGAIKLNISLNAAVKKQLPAIDRALMFLHEHKAIHLQGGMAVLRQAMTIRLEPEARRRRYTIGDFKPLSVHYREKRFHVHVMVEYVQLGLEKIAKAIALVLDYFTLGRVKFINKYFKDRKELIEKAATHECYRQIVERLGNPVQIAIVGGPVEQNTLILAGPGSGKTTVIVHRCAYLLQVERIPAQRILVLCFNHNAAVGLRKRLNELAGKQARAVTVATYHGAAMRIAGISVRDMVESEKIKEVDFDKVIQAAVKLLKGGMDITGADQDEVREKLLGGYSHILVDEYQDIDQHQYELVAAIAGKPLRAGDGKLAIMAVGDDDQNIYAFRGANVHFIKQFHHDYQAQVTYLVENYRSTRHIIRSANQLISQNKDRMKTGYPIRINRERENSLPGGRWSLTDPVSKGRVQIINVRNPFQQALGVVEEIERLMALSRDFDLKDCAILSRTKKGLAHVRSVLEQAGYPIKTTLEKTIPVHRVRETAFFIDFLHRQEKEAVRASGILEKYLEHIHNQADTIWKQMAVKFLENYRDETVDALLPSEWMIDQLYEYLAEQRREKMIGNGIFLGTIHSAKGMEFSTLFVLDGDWNIPAGIKEWEEERRLLYVALTRAKEMLVIMKSAERTNPHINVFAGDGIVSRKCQISAAQCANMNFFEYEIMGLDDIYMDYAGGFSKDHPVHGNLSRLEAGSEVFLVHGKRHIEIHDADNACIGRLANKAVETWKKRLERVHKVRVLCILTRNSSDPDESFQKRVKAEKWELPVLEVVSRL